MHFTFVRHAQPEWTRGGLSVDDPPLTALGRAQAERLGHTFEGQRVDALLVSPLVRAAETAVPVARALDIEPQFLPWLAEIAAPAWEGTPAEQVERTFREHRGRPVEEMWDGLEGGESFYDFHRRVSIGLQTLLDAAGNDRLSDDPALWRVAEPVRRVVVVAHGGTNATAIGHLLGIPPVPWEWERFVSFHASVSTLEPMEVSGRHAYSLYRFADVAHLPPGLQTR
jgi:broad specificity phosphatase PhoE